MDTLVYFFFDLHDTNTPIILKHDISNSKIKLSWWISMQVDDNTIKKYPSPHVPVSFKKTFEGTVSVDVPSLFGKDICIILPSKEQIHCSQAMGDCVKQLSTYS